MKFQYKNCRDKVLPGLFIETASKYSDKIIYKYKKNRKIFSSISYRDFYLKVKEFAGGLIGLKLDGKKMGIISDNCIEWMITVLANMGMGGIDIPRGINTGDNELKHILIHADPEFICVQNKDAYDKLKKLNILNNLKIVIFDPNGIKLSKNDISFNDVCKSGEKYLKYNEDFFKDRVSRLSPDDIASIIYTSGTTGVPKGVMLSHKNLTFAPTEVPGYVTAYDTDVWMSILPMWHVGERFFEFMGIIHGVTIILSSVYSVRDDMKKEKPHLIPGVPLVWKRIMNSVIKGIEEKGKGNFFNFFYKKSLSVIQAKRILFGKNARYKNNSIGIKILSVLKIWFFLPFHIFANILIYNKIREVTGGNIRMITSGGGRLPDEVDDFFEVMGFEVIDGYGSTETAVLVTVRKTNGIRNTIGGFLPDTEYKIINMDTGEKCEIGEPGLIYVKGDQIFKGYYKNKKETEKVLDSSGWYNTGDLVKQTVTGNLVFVGRMKDTIVMLNGENVEPEPIEEAIEDSDYIKYSLVVGQDKEELSALIFPDFDGLKIYLNMNELSYNQKNELVKDDNIYKLFKKEIRSRVNTKKGFKINELVKKFILINDDFMVGVELTNTMKKRRNIIIEKYKKNIDKF